MYCNKKELKKLKDFRKKLLELNQDKVILKLFKYDKEIIVGDFFADVLDEMIEYYIDNE